MHIVCPNCTTSYAVNPSTFGDAGRTVRCARCKEVWLARPEDLSRPRVAALAASQPEPEEDLSAWGVTAGEEPSIRDIPVVESPSISADWPTDANHRSDYDWVSDPDISPSAAYGRSSSRFGALRRLVPAAPRLSFKSPRVLPAVTVTMFAMVMALMIWRVDVVRLMPQTAIFYQATGMPVNVRGLAFKDVKVSSETVDGKPVMVIEGNIVSETRVPAAMPRLRFVVRDDHGTEIYAWSAVLEQPGLNPGDKAWFRSRLASPPAEARSIDVRFFNKRDISGT